MTTLIGQQLGRYQIQEEIGRGGMARVYRARDLMLQRQVALKVLAPQLALDQEFLRRFEREAITAANLRHPNIVTVYDVGEANGLRYIAMEYVRGRTLHAIIKERGALGLALTVGIVAPVAAALDYAHSQGAVHRDVKPQNILIDVEGRVLLADFGIAQGPDAGGGERLTRTGIFMGTPEYISPEQASAQRVDGRSDLYSLGVATYEMITGMVPFSGATPQLIVAHVQTPPPPPSGLDPAAPPELDLVLARALAKRPENRFGSGAAFVEALRIVARRHALTPATPPTIAGLVLPQLTVRTALDGPGGSPRTAAALSATPRAPARVPSETPTRPEARSTPRGEPVPPLRDPTPRDTANRPTPPGIRRNGTAARTPARSRRIPGGMLTYGIAGGAAVALLLALILAGASGFGRRPSAETPVANILGTSVPSATTAPTETATPTETAFPSATTAPTETAAPTEAPTVLPVEPEPIPPTDIPPTDIPPTDIPPTDVPPTITPTLELTPTLEPALTPTLALATATNTAAPTSEAGTTPTAATATTPEVIGTTAATTAVPAAATAPTTNTPRPPSPTVTSSPTVTPVTPTPTPTTTATPTASATPTETQAPPQPAELPTQELPQPTEVTPEPAAPTLPADAETPVP
ncbi:MAG: hypothetical protein RLZZ387_1024 [Chloroflexota bacterium]|jgi:serine/threonine-protein kinase